MKKTICKIEYDTDNAELIKKYVSGSFGDPKGDEERLYQNAKGNFFLYVNGGAQSAHPAEDIVKLSKDKAAAWLERH